MNFYIADMGKTSQRKGNDGERELRDKLRAYGYDVDNGGARRLTARFQTFTGCRGFTLNASASSG